MIAKYDSNICQVIITFSLLTFKVVHHVYVKRKIPKTNLINKQKWRLLASITTVNILVFLLMHSLTVTMTMMSV